MDEFYRSSAISLFSGVGGLDIGFSAAGYNIKAQVEIDPFCQRVLKRHAHQWWPDSTVFPDVKQFGRANVIGEIEIIFGGFPCQPHSNAGKRLGAADDRNLWPEFRRIIGEFRPRVVLLENVPGILTGYATVIVAELTALGYDSRWGTIQAADTGAPHKRERWFCVGDSKSCDDRRKYRRVAEAACKAQDVRGKFTSSDQNMGNPQSAGLPERGHGQIKNSCPIGKAPGLTTNTRSQRSGSIDRRISSQSRMGGKSDGIPAWLDEPRWPAAQGSYQHQWEAPRTIGKGIDPHRTPRIKALGNAVLPQIAYQIACAIREL